MFILRYLILQYSRKIYSSYSFGIGNSWNFNWNRADKEGRYERAGWFNCRVIINSCFCCCYFKVSNVALNIGLFIVLLLGSYGMIRGILEILYSLKLQRRKSNNVKIEIMKIVVAVTEFI